MRTVATSLSVPTSLDHYISIGLVSKDSVVSARLIMELHDVSAEAHPWVCIALAIVLENPTTGNSCIRVEELTKWDEKVDVDVEVWLRSVDKWLSVLRAHPLLVTQTPEDCRAPFVLDGHALYAENAFVEESYVAARLHDMLLSGRLKVITGGPGSGKTTSIAEILIEHLSQPENGEDTISLAAPTGLAAKRMRFALENALKNPKISVLISDQVRTRIANLPKSTVHKLLKYNPSSRRQYRKNADDQLDIDVMIVDEVSMMPLTMMVHLLEALKPEATLILVGDKDQLASVESGSVLADICLASEMGPSFVNHMRGKYRFPEGSPVAVLSDAINKNDKAALLQSLNSEYPIGVDVDGNDLPRFTWVNPLDDPQGLSDTAKVVLQHARDVCEAALTATSDEDMLNLLDLRGQLQLVCAHKRGKFGVAGWNSTIDRKLGTRAKGQWYVGRPVMVLVNDYVNDLSNGDIGVICQDNNQQRFAVFSGENGIRRIPVTKLPPVETVHALTIHKSQGSEYAHTVVVLPLQPSRIVTRELVYTGITRAKPHLTVVSTQDVLVHAASTNIRRATGLADRLYDLLEANQDRWPFVADED
jgi:exodeoxyribonuclease V alpha subunit